MIYPAKRMACGGFISTCLVPPCPSSSVTVSKRSCFLYGSTISMQTYNRLCGSELLGDLLQIINRVDIDNLVDLGRVPEQLLCAGVEHAELAVAGDGEVEQEYVGNRLSSGGLCVGSCKSNHVLSILSNSLSGCSYQGHRVAQEHESGRVVWQVISDLFEALVDGLVVVLLDLLGRFIDHVCARGTISAPDSCPGTTSCCNCIIPLWRRAGDVHTDDGLGVVGPRRSQPELSQVVLGILREGVQPRFGALPTAPRLVSYCAT